MLGQLPSLGTRREDLKFNAEFLLKKFPTLDEKGLVEVLKTHQADYPIKDLAGVLVDKFPKLNGNGEDLAKALKVYGKGNAANFKDYKNALAEVSKLEFGKMGVQDRISMLQSAFPNQLSEILTDLMKPASTKHNISQLSFLSRAEIIKNVDVEDKDLHTLVKVLIGDKESGYHSSYLVGREKLELAAEAIATVKPGLETNTLLEAIFKSVLIDTGPSVKNPEEKESTIIRCVIAIEKAKAKAKGEKSPTQEDLTKAALEYFKHKELYMDVSKGVIDEKKMTSIVQSLQLEIGGFLSSDIISKALHDTVEVNPDYDKQTENKRCIANAIGQAASPWHIRGLRHAMYYDVKPLTAYAFGAAIEALSAAAVTPVSRSRFRRQANSLISFRKNKGCEVTEILTAEIMKDISCNTLGSAFFLMNSTKERIVREELEKALEQKPKETGRPKGGGPSFIPKDPYTKVVTIDREARL